MSRDVPLIDSEVVSNGCLAWLEGHANAELDHARRLDCGRQPRRGARHWELFDLETLVEQVVRVQDRRHAARADREPFLQPRIDGHRKGETRAAVAEGAHRFEALIESRGVDKR